jgi:hypothetical protein
MSNTALPRRMTRVHEELEPSAPLQATLDLFLEDPRSEHRFYTQANRIVSTEEYRDDANQIYIQAAERRLRQIGSRTLALAPTVQVRAHQDKLTLLFDVAESDQSHLATMISALDEIEWEPVAPRGLYVQIARSSLAKNAEQRREAARQLTSQLRDPHAEKQIRVGNPRLVSKDILLKP